MSSFRLPLLLISLTLAAADAPAPFTPDPAAVRRYREDVTFLAAPEQGGRGVGTPGIANAAKRIESRLRGAGLQPAFAGGWRQPFRMKTGVALGAGNRLEGFADGEWIPLAPSAAGAFAGEAVFAGYGIAAPALGYDDFAGLDLKGKVAVMLRYEPQEQDNDSPFDGRRPSRWSALRYKVLQARERGAVAVVFITGPLNDDGRDGLPALKNDGPESPAGLPVLQVKRAAAERWLAGSGLDLRAWQLAVDRDLRPRSRPLARPLAGTVAVSAAYADAENVAAMLPGAGALAGETVVIGAHYDHLGLGGEGSMTPDAKAIHPGADDNASGTAGVLYAADRARALLGGLKNRRTVVFALFSGEEKGLAGSAAFAENPPPAARRIVAMINLDMVGRLQDGALAALGADSAPEWKPALERLAPPLGLRASGGGDGYGPSDQTSFYAKGVPVLHFFTGTHADYHAPGDTADKVNAEGGARVGELTIRLGGEIAAGALTPRFARAAAAPATAGDARGYGAWLGTVPDYRAMAGEGGGVLLSDVRAGSPAELAGIRGGDRIVSLAGTRIENLYDMTYALQDHKPGETVEVTVLRAGARVTMRATLGSRGAMRGEVKAPPASAPASAPVAVPASAPADPHAAPAAAPPRIVGEAWYDDRPGKDFVVGAGRPYAKTVAGERHLADIRQLTFGGENAEAYFSPDGRSLIYQATPRGARCDQEFVLDLVTGATRQVSTGGGRTTCGYFRWPQGDKLLYASTRAGGEACPDAPDRSHGYVWGVFAGYDLWMSDPDGGHAGRLTDAPGYDAEATWCPRGGKLVFTSARDGDLELYEMDEARNVRRLTDAPGYDGGAFYSPDCREIVWRAGRPQPGPELAEYRALLAKGLVKPTVMELWIMNADGGHPRQLTKTGRANFGPYFHPDGTRIIYSSNAGTPEPREFDLYLIPKTGGDPERVTFAEGFDGFPIFSPDGRWLVWGSNRADPASHETNLFIAKWVE